MIIKLYLDNYIGNANWLMRERSWCYGMERIETNPQFAQIISPSDMIAIVTLNIKIGEVDGLMNICLPYLTLEHIMDKLNTKYWFSTMQETNENYDEYMNITYLYLL